ncbi:MAG TPA: DUF2267 domain-containing protein [Candidatus Dormibacteraeota bacterium]|nr:DUF2267 domain-containing protein [Candidatus Dormibacteraeota bacterium]
MTDQEFIQAVERAGDMDGERASHAAEAVLATLAGAVIWGEAQNIADQLPPRLARVVRDNSFSSSMARFSRKAFIREVGERVGAPAERAERDLDAVVAVLERVLPPVRRTRLRTELGWLGRH